MNSVLIPCSCTTRACGRLVNKKVVMLSHGLCLGRRMDVAYARIVQYVMVHRTIVPNPRSSSHVS